MRNIKKLPVPAVLVNNRALWEQALASNDSDHNRNKYRDPEIKGRLLEETRTKCVYCESKIGHNCPGDIEHKIPKSKRSDLIFEWENLTIACSECNRRKRDYYDPNCMFLDPNTDDVEKLVQHVGPLVFSFPGESRSEVTIRLLELDSVDGRVPLFARKFERLELLRNLVERIAHEKNKTLKEFLKQELVAYCSIDAEFSGMVKTYVETLPPGWDS